MKTSPYFFGKHLLILLAFFSLAGNTSFAFSSESFVTEAEAESYLQKPDPKVLVCEQLESSEAYEPAERSFSGTGNTTSSVVLPQKSTFKTGTYSFLIRDLKAGITSQLFPSHFFL